MGGDHDVGPRAQRAEIARELGERRGVRPRADQRGNAGTIRGRDAGASDVEHRLVRGVAREDSDPRRIVGGLMAGGPVDGGSLQEPETQALVRHDGGGARGSTIHSRSGVRNADSVEALER